MPRVLATHTPELFEQAVKLAAAELLRGNLVALPTETVYGLAADAFSPSAVAKIFAAKKRPARNPVIVHVSGVEMARECVVEWSNVADELARSFWPGPLTMVLRKSGKIPDEVTAGGPTVGVRWPSHPFIQEVIRTIGRPLAAPSANLSNGISPTNAEHVMQSLGDQLNLIIDGGHSQVGIESAVVDLTSTPARLLRPGMIDELALMSVTGELTIGFGDSEEVLRSPGLLKKHYAPKSRLLLLSWQSESELLKRLGQEPVKLERVFVVAHSRIPMSDLFGRVSVVPHDSEAYARALYGELHACDQGGAELIVVEAPPSGPEWRGIEDRLRRASSSEE
jgi:L-threonylcarbamoyladenylate synthase